MADYPFSHSFALKELPLNFLALKMNFHVRELQRGRYYPWSDDYHLSVGQTGLMKHVLSWKLSF